MFSTSRMTPLGMRRYQVAPGSDSSGSSYPAAVILAGAERGWDAKDIPGYRTPLLYTASSNTADTGQMDLPTGWQYSTTLGIVTTADNAALANWDTNGRPVIIKHSNVTVSDCYVTNNGKYSSGRGYGIRLDASGTPTNVTVEYNEVDGQGEGGGTCVFTATLVTGLLTVSAVSFGELSVGMVIDTGIATLVQISSLGTGTGGTGTYNLSDVTQTLGSQQFVTRPWIGACVNEYASAQHSGFVIRGNYLHGGYDDTIQLNSSGTVVEDNRICVGGWNGPTAHWDGIQISNPYGTDGPILITGNYIDATPGVPGVSPTVGTLGTSYGATTCGLLAANASDGVTYSQNIFGGAGALVNDESGYPLIYAGYINWGNDLDIQNNVFEWGTGVIYTTNIYQYTAWANNYRLSTAGVVPAPTTNRTTWQREDDTFWQTEADGSVWVKEEL